jgi:hypothetical protein
MENNNPSDLSDEELLAELEAETNIPVSNDRLQQISEIADKMVDLASFISKVEGILAKKKEELDRIQYGDLPDAMDGVGMTEFRLRDGTRLEVIPVLKVSYKEENVDAVDDFFNKTGNTGLMKRTISAIIPRGEPEANYRKVKEFIAKAGYEAEDKKGVHYQTLNKWAREWSEQGETIPDDIFNVFQGRQARIRKGK